MNNILGGWYLMRLSGGFWVSDEIGSGTIWECTAGWFTLDAWKTIR